MAAEYLDNRRGLQADSVIQEINKFRLGFVADPLIGHEQYRGMLAIPYLRRSAEGGWDVVSLRFRCIEDHDCKALKHGKYRTVPGDRPRMYNTLALLQDTETIGISEGEIDALTASICGIPTVGIPGSTSWQPYFREPFLGYKTVYIFADGDAPGLKFAETVAKTMPNSKIIPMPDKQDVNSLYLSEGPKALLERIK